MKRFKFKSIVSRLAFHVSVAVFLVSIAFSTLNYFGEKKDIEERMSAKLGYILDTASSSLTLPVWRIDYPAMEGIIKSFARKSEVVSIELFDLDYQPIYSATKSDKSYEEYMTYTDEVGILYNGEFLASVKISITDYYEVKFFQKTVSKNMLLLVFQIIIILFMIQFLTTRELQPLSRINQAAKRIAEGDFEHFITEIGDNEIGALGTTINNMQGKLNIQKKQILHNMNKIRLQNEKLVNANMEIEALYGQTKAYSQQLEASIEMNRLAYFETVKALAKAIEAKDHYTAGHCERVASLSVEIGRHLKLEEQDLETLHLAATLHDIGKIGISSEVLNKEGKLTAEEYDYIKQHPRIGYDILCDITSLKKAAEIVLQHHERWDGKGYPCELKATETSLEARIIGIVDAFDAMTSSRPYRKQARSIEEAMREILNGKGKQFDEEIAEILLKIIVLEGEAYEKK